MSKRVIVNPKPAPSKELFTDPSTWPFQDAEGKRLVISKSEIIAKNPKYGQEIDEILTTMQHKAKYVGPIIDYYSSYLAQTFAARLGPSDFIRRCSYSCGGILFHIGEKTDWKIWLTAPIINSRTKVPGDELYYLWADHFPIETNETDDEHYDRFCHWAHEHGKLVSDMLRHGAIVFVP